LNTTDETDEKRIPIALEGNVYEESPSSEDISDKPLTSNNPALPVSIAQDQNILESTTVHGAYSIARPCKDEEEAEEAERSRSLKAIERLRARYAKERKDIEDAALRGDISREDAHDESIVRVIKSPPKDDANIPTSSSATSDQNTKNEVPESRNFSYDDDFDKATTYSSKAPVLERKHTWRPTELIDNLINGMEAFKVDIWKIYRIYKYERMKHNIHNF
jgi:hypothetical protein